MIIHDKQFELFISSNQIQSQIADLAERISADYADKCPLFIGVLNGSFMFASDLLKEVNIQTSTRDLKQI